MILNVNEYDIIIEDNLLANLKEHIKKVYPYEKVFIVTDKNLFRLYEQKLKEALQDFDVHIVAVEPGEHSKSLQTYEQLSKYLINQGMKRNHLLIAFGGGVIGDLVGFVAGTLYRGVPFIQIPTSLLAMVDSSIGGKTGIDLPEGKNLLGVFKNPRVVLIDPQVLETLPIEEYRNGLAEVVKAAIIDDKDLFEYLKSNDTLTIEKLVQAIEVKRKIVLKDPYEENIRMYLNFGHTFGHAIERHYDYAIKHGVAVAYGMLMSLKEGNAR
ncbi:MAG TPA: 3-dehydroquinate synthase, partial [Acholeplasma sp.]|nr:3-dehydroquinate synthase [Acholeplasma sp.]